MHVFFSELKKGGYLTQEIPPRAKTIDFALGESAVTDGRLLTAGTWRFSPCPGTIRGIKKAGRNKGCFFSVVIPLEDYGKLPVKKFPPRGVFTSPMAYPILKLISGPGAEDTRYHDPLTLFYIHSILVLLGDHSAKKPPVRFDELKSIYEAMEGLHPMNFPTPSTLATQTGIKAFRFQKGCSALFGQSAQKIIQHLKMKQAFDDIQIHQKSIEETSIGTGYRHSLNFITAFHHHFGITPLEAAQGRVQ